MWNYEKIRSPHSERINRYIMECKYSIKKEYEDWKKELIDTLWNVNNVMLVMNPSNAKN